MVDTLVKDLWGPAGILLGFQVTLFTWRIKREADIRDEGKKAGKVKTTWITPADYLGLFGMVAFLFGVFLLPILGSPSSEDVAFYFGIGALFFVGQSLGLIGHYNLFFSRKHWGDDDWFTPQEKIVVIAILMIAFGLFVYMNWCSSPLRAGEAS